ncbi:unnamed protein product, partial [Discosporangium mesarthrocarpum]
MLSSASVSLRTTIVRSILCARSRSPLLLGNHAYFGGGRVASMCGSMKRDGDKDKLLGEKIARKIEAWLLPEDTMADVAPAFHELYEALRVDLALTEDEWARLPINVLMLKALQDRQLLLKDCATSSGHENSHAREGGKQHDPLESEDLKIVAEAEHFSRFAMAAYGVIGNLDELKAMVCREGKVPPPDALRSRATLERWLVAGQTDLAPEDITQLDTVGSAETLAFFVSLDHTTRSVVLSIRGTFSVSDTLTDMLCGSVDFLEGTAHQGVARSAMALWDDVRGGIEDLLREHKGYQLVLTGHSLGAGAAILIKLLLSDPATGNRGEGEWEDLQTLQQEENDRESWMDHRNLRVGRTSPVKCYAFAPPSIYSEKGGLPPEVEAEGIYAFVNRFDCVPRLSLRSIYDAFRSLRCIDQTPLDNFQRVLFILETRAQLMGADDGLRAAGALAQQMKELGDTDLSVQELTDLAEALRVPSFTSSAVFSSSSSSSSSSPKPLLPGLVQDLSEGQDSENAEKKDRGHTHHRADDRPSLSTPSMVKTRRLLNSAQFGVSPPSEDLSGEKLGVGISQTSPHLWDTVRRIRARVRDVGGRVGDRFGKAVESLTRMSPEEVMITALRLRGLGLAGGEAGSGLGPQTGEEVLAMVVSSVERGRRGVSADVMAGGGSGGGKMPAKDDCGKEEGKGEDLVGAGNGAAQDEGRQIGRLYIPGRLYWMGWEE